MKPDTSRLLIENVVKNALKEIKNSPGRGLRNLVDMALHFSAGRFQHTFFDAAQRMLQNENSSYYDLIEDLVAHTDLDTLLRFGMNLGYNGCTIGAKRIRNEEAAGGYNIPWTVLLQMDPACSEESFAQYEDIIYQGEKLGIYTWMLFAPKLFPPVLKLTEAHPDCAFILFCNPQGLTSEVLDAVSDKRNLMLAVRYTEQNSEEETGRADDLSDMADAEEIFARMRENGILYSCWNTYSREQADEIVNGNVFCSMEQLNPAFSVLVPEESCPADIRRQVSDYVEAARNEQAFKTVPWELDADNRRIDSIISDDACGAAFDVAGDLEGQDGDEHYNIYRHSLTEILQRAFPKKTH